MSRFTVDRSYLPVQQHSLRLQSHRLRSDSEQVRLPYLWLRSHSRAEKHSA